VDFGFFLPERPYWQLVTEHLRPGDISTHVFRAAVPWIDENGKVYDYLKQARARGVRFDVGHGSGSLVMRNAVPAIAQGFYPDSISTDLHVPSMNRGLMDFPTTASKFLAMGMPLTEVVLRSTWNPAQMIHHPEVGHLTVGAVADVTLWSIEKGDFGFRDSSDAMIKGAERLRCEMTLKGGVIEWDWNSRSAVDYRKLGPTYGLRPGADTIILPLKNSAPPH
jgi:dihydroorotase